MKSGINILISHHTLGDMNILKWQTRFYFCHYLTGTSMETDRTQGTDRCMTYMIPPSHTFNQKPRGSVLFIQSSIIWIFHVIYSVNCSKSFVYKLHFLTWRSTLCFKAFLMLKPVFIFYFVNLKVIKFSNFLSLKILETTYKISTMCMIFNVESKLSHVTNTSLFTHTCDMCM